MELPLKTHIEAHLRRPLVLIAALATLPMPAQEAPIVQGRAALARGDFDAAIPLLEKAVARSPKDAEAHHCLANAYGTKAARSGMFAAARYAPRAKGEWEQAVALNPKYLDARFSLVEFYAMAPGLMGGSMDKAIEQAKAIQALDPVLGHRAFGLVYVQQKKPDLAKKEYLDAIREYPTSGRAHGYLGQHYANEEKNYRVAFTEFETGLKLEPVYMPLYYHLGRAAALAGTNLARGEEVLRRYLAYTPKENEPPLANAHYRLGMIYQQEGKRAEAKQSYQEALRLDASLKEAAEALKRVL